MSPNFPPAFMRIAAADRAGDAGEAFDAGQALADGAEDELLHVDAGADLDVVLVELARGASIPGRGGRPRRSRPRR